ncbi:hypothetical protein GQS52_12010 [Streptomyces sp. SCUT-3]|uniref:hypothetical protein n=1 Tax=Streptomyces sp. SCUT-3 TaxID=2684469 RepID=UPI0015FBC2E5|nr:hypothetical protein [Streptomyces sp. SCUT-3]QMV22397.1 hypothetical protein GQS52_12010 [Streptomyces sp. SCUT-3]
MDLDPAPVPHGTAPHPAATDPTPPPGAADDAMDLDPAPVPHGTAPHPAATDPTPRPGAADDAMDVDMDAGAHPPAHAPEAAPAVPVGGAHPWTPPGAGQGAVHRFTLVNDAFREGSPGRTTPPAGALTENAYLDFVRDSVAESRPLGFVVNAIVRWDGLANGGLQRFLDTVGAGLHGFDRRVAVVIGVNGPDSALAAIQAAMRTELGNARFAHPVALVHVPYNATGGSFQYGTVRNAVLESAVGTHLARTMMEHNLHPYFSVMDFDFHPHVVPDGRHVFQYFEETLRMPDAAALRAAGEMPEPPLRPLMMAGGYRAPDLTAAGARSELIAEANARIAKDAKAAADAAAAKEAAASGKGKGKGKAAAGPSPVPDAAASGTGKGKGAKGKGAAGPKAAPTIAPAELPGLLRRIEHDMNARTRLAAVHPQLPYIPEPNLFVDAAATMLSREGGDALRFGGGAGEFATLGNRLNQLNAWEMNRRLPLPAFTGTADEARDLLGRAAASLRPGGVRIPAHELPAAQDAIRQLADALDGPRPALGGFGPGDAGRLRSLADSLGHPVPPHGKAPDTTATPQLLNKAVDALDTRLAERAVAAGNNTLPERGAAFVNDVQGAAVPTDVARLIAGAKRTGKLPQDHGDLKNPMDRLVGTSEAGGSAQTARKGLYPAHHRDEWTARPDDGPAGGATGVPTGRDPLFPHRHDPQPARPADPAPGAHDHSAAPPRTRTAGGVSGTLDSRLGADTNPPSTAVSAGVPGADGLRAGISPDELRLATRDLALSNDRMALLRRLRYLREEHLGPGTQPLPQPPGSLFDALSGAAQRDASLAPERLLSSTVDGLDKPYSKPMPVDTGESDYAKKLGTWHSAAKREADKNLNPVIDALGAEKISVEDFFTRLAQGRIHPPSGTLREFIGSGERFAMDPGGLLVLKQYAAALSRDIHVTGGDGVTHVVEGAASAGAKRRRDGGSVPLHLTWEHGSGWRVGPPQAAPPAPAPGGPGGPGPAGRPGAGDGGGAGFDGPPPSKRRRPPGGTDGTGPSTGPAPSGSAPSGSGPGRATNQQQDAETAWEQYSNAQAELNRATRDLDLLRAQAGESSSGSSALETVTRRARAAQDALNRAEQMLEQLGIDVSHRLGRLRLDDSAPPPGPHHHPSDGGAP